MHAGRFLRARRLRCMTSAGQLIKAVSWLSLGNLSTRMLALVTLPLLTRWLSPESYGEAALVSTVVALASVLGLVGIDMSYSRHFFSDHRTDTKAVEVFCWRWAIGATMLVAGAFGVFWAQWLAVRLGADPALAGFVVIGIVASTLATMAKARARLRARYFRLSLTEFIAGLSAALITLLVAYTWRQDAWPLLLAMVVGYAIPVFGLGMPSLRLLSRYPGLDKGAAWRILQTGLAGVVTGPAYWIVSSSDRWFLASYHGSGEVGIYSIGATVGTVGMAVSMAITSAWLPELARAEAAPDADPGARRGELSQMLVAAMWVVWLAVMAAGGDMIRLLADERFHAATTVIPWLATGVLFYGVMHVGNAQLILLGKLKWAAAAWMGVLVLSLALNAQLVSSFGGVGAACAQAICFFVIMVLVWIPVLRVLPIKLRWGRLGASSALIVVAGTCMVAQWGESALMSMAIKFPLGLVLGALCFHSLAPSLSTRGMQMLLGKRGGPI